VAETTSSVLLPSNSRTRATLLNRLRDGSDLVAWDEFFRRYWTLVFSFARHRGCSAHTAEEVVQDVMVKVFEQKDLFRYDSERGRFRDWLGAVVRNKVIDLRRRAGGSVRGIGGELQDEVAEMAAEGASPDDKWEAAFEESLLLTLLDVVRREMSPRAYLAFELTALHGLPGAKVARHTGLTRNGVYRAKKRAMARLRELGAEYRRDGQLSGRIKEALRRQPDASVERALTERIERTMWSAREGVSE
jgi:RNA polymerase sigma-70 factor (ECF subfamily)